MATIHQDIDGQAFKPTTTTEPITAWVAIGDGQPGAYLIQLDHQIKGVDKKAILGIKADVLGKALRINATITDVMGQTNWTSITVFVQEGIKKPAIYGPYQYEVPADKDSIVYTFKTEFQ